MRQRICGSKETEICLQIGKKYRVYATGCGIFYDGDRYKDYILEWNNEKDSAWLVRIEENHKQPFTSGFKMVNFGTWIVRAIMYDYYIEEIEEVP